MSADSDDEDVFVLQRTDYRNVRPRTEPARSSSETEEPVELAHDEHQVRMARIAHEFKLAQVDPAKQRASGAIVLEAMNGDDDEETKNPMMRVKWYIADAVSEDPFQKPNSSAIEKIQWAAKMELEKLNATGDDQYIELHMEFTETYPREPPKVRLFWPMVTGSFIMEGGFCLEVFKAGDTGGWTMATSVEALLQSATAMLLDGHIRIPSGLLPLPEGKTKQFFDPKRADAGTNRANTIYHSKGWHGKAPA